MAPVVWRIECPQEVKDHFVMVENPNGDISILELELAAVLLGWIMIKDLVDTKWKYLGVLCDNNPAVA